MGTSERMPTVMTAPATMHSINVNPLCFRSLKKSFIGCSLFGPIARHTGGGGCKDVGVRANAPRASHDRDRARGVRSVGNTRENCSVVRCRAEFIAAKLTGRGKIHEWRATANTCDTHGGCR